MPVIEDVIIWSASKEPDLPKFRPQEIADFILEQKYHILQSVLCLFEAMPMPVEAVREITRAEGKIAREAVAYEKSLEALASMIRDDSFEFSRSVLERVHAIVSEPKLPPDRRGIFRQVQTCWHGILHTAPGPEELDTHWEEGAKAILALPGTPERALAGFAWLMRMQFFLKCNKRTALLMAYGLLAQAGYRPFIVPVEAARSFNHQLTLFLETGGCDMLFTLIKTCMIKKMEE